MWCLFGGNRCSFGNGVCVVHQCINPSVHDFSYLYHVNYIVSNAVTG